MAVRMQRSRRKLAVIVGAVGVAVLSAYLVRRPEPSAAPPIAPDESAARLATLRRLEWPGDTEQVASALSGRVHTRSASVAEALVCAACLSCEMTTAAPAPCVTTDEDGVYAFSGLTPAGYLVQAAADGFMPNTANSGAPVFVVAGQSAMGVDIELIEGGVPLTGTVVDATGGPIAGAHVRAVRMLPRRTSLDRVSDEDGRFAFPLDPGFIQLVAQAEGYARASVRATAPGDVEIRLIPGSTVEGTVVMAGSQTPVGHVEVKAISSSTPHPDLAPSDVTDQHGRFRIRGLEPGRYALEARGERSRGLLREPLDVGVAEHRTGIVVEVHQTSLLAGRVRVEGEARPCRQGTVSLGNPSPVDPLPPAAEITAVTGGARIDRATGPGQTANIQADGSVHFPGVEAGYYFARVSCHGYRLHSGPRVLRVAEADAAEVTWTVVPAGRAVVRVVDERNAPIPQADFYLEFPSRGPRVVSSYRADAEGIAALEDLAPGRYELHAPDGYDQVEPVGFSIPERAADVHVTLRLPGSGFVLVHVENERSEPVDGLWVKAARVEAAGSGTVARSADGPTEAPALPMGAGAYRIGPLAEGTYGIAVYDGVNPALEPGAPRAPRVRVTRGGTIETHVQLSRGGAIEGQVLDHRGAPAADVWVSAAQDGAPSSSAARRAMAAARATPRRVLSDAQGRFSIDGLANDASFRVRAAQPSGGAAVLSGVRPGDPVTLRLLETATLSGVALDSSGRPVTQFAVRALNAEIGSREAKPVADPEGRFSLADVAPGTVQLALDAPGGRSAHVTLNVAPGQHVAGLRLQLQPVDIGLRERGADAPE